MIKLGTKNLSVPANTKVYVQANEPFVIKHGDVPIGFSVNNVLTFDCREDCELTIDIGSKAVWTADGKRIKSMYDPVDPIPVEIPEEYNAPPTLEDKMKLFLAEMVAERYGKDSKEMESFEDSMDFDMDDDDMPLSQYEVHDMQPEYVNESESLSDQPEASLEADIPAGDVQPDTTE